MPGELNLCRFHEAVVKYVPLDFFIAECAQTVGVQSVHTYAVQLVTIAACVFVYCVLSVVLSRQ